MTRNLAVLSGSFTLLMLAACGSATTSALGGTAPTSSATPTQPAIAAPTTVVTPAPTAVPAATSAPAMGTAIALRRVGSLGQILVGGNGRTLYLFLGDVGATSTRSGSCAQNWPPLTTVGAPRATDGVLQSLLGPLQGSTRVSQTTSSPLSFVVTWSSLNPSFSRTRSDGVFQLPTVDQSRVRPVATAASRTARAAAASAAPC
jgi:predicted lipoprotein with Yx(FWY)xxD motif